MSASPIMMEAQAQQCDVVAVDIGGTHARFAIATVKDGRVKSLGVPTTLKTAEHASFQTAWQAFAALNTTPLPRAVAIAFAGPVSGEVLQLTNSHWVVRPALIPERLDVNDYIIVNDFGAVGHAVAQAEPGDFIHLCGPERAMPVNGVISIIGPGTGLGVAQLLRDGAAYRVVETEGGHGDFAPLDGFEDGLLTAMRQQTRRVSVERIVSGPGIRALYEALARVEGLVMHPLILGIVEQMLLPWCERIALNLTQAIEIHPGALPQLPHRDQDMWGGPKGSMEYLVNVMWPLTPFRPENGGTRLWSGSHLDKDVQLLSEDDAVSPLVLPGDALIFLGSTLHGGGGNVSPSPRRGIVVSYCLGWLKPFELQWLVYPPQIAKHFSPQLAALVGYAQHRPNLGNVEGQCPSILLGDTVPDFLPAVDALRPDQAEAADMFVRSQLGEMG